MKDQKIRLLFSISLLLSQCLFGQTEFLKLNGENDWEYALSTAESTDLPLMVYVCNPAEAICNDFQEDIFKDKEIENYLSKRFIQLEVNTNSYWGSAFANAFHIDYLPAILCFDNKGRAVGRQMGEATKESLLSFFKSSRSRAAQYDQLMEAWKNDKLQSDGYCACADIFTLNERYYDAQKAGVECLRGLSPIFFTAVENREKLFAFGLDLSLPILPYFVENHDYIQNQNPEFPLVDFYKEAYIFNLEEALVSKDSLRIAFLLDHLWPYLKESSGIPDSSKTLELYWENTADWTSWAEHHERKLDSDSLKMKSFRKVLDPVRLEHANDSTFLSWLQTYAEKSSFIDNYQSAYLYAWSSFYNGQIEQASSALKKAQELQGDLSQKAECRELEMRIRFAIRSK